MDNFKTYYTNNDLFNRLGVATSEIKNNKKKLSRVGRFKAFFLQIKFVILAIG